MGGDDVARTVRPGKRANRSISGTVSAPGIRDGHDEARLDAREGTGLTAVLESLRPHDHLCLIYESKEEWRAAAIPFIAIGLRQGQKCMYVVDAHTADDIRRYLAEEGIDVASAEQSGRFVVLHETEAYTRDGSFDPDRMIALLIEETNRAVAAGYPALRVTGEMTWMLRGQPGSEKVLEYEAKLNRDLFPHHPCMAICQYDRRRFAPEIIKGVIMTHPLLVRGHHVYRNFYYVPPQEFLSATHADTEVEHWLDNLERERRTEEALRESEDKFRSIFERSIDLINICAPDGSGLEVNQAWLDLLGYSRDELPALNAIDIYAHPEDRADFLRRMAETGSVEDEVRFRKKDGTVVVCRRAAVARKDDRGNTVAIHGNLPRHHRAKEGRRGDTSARRIPR